MTVRIASVALDVPDLPAAEAFWSATLGYVRTGDGPGWVYLGDPAGTAPGVFLQHVGRPVRPGARRSPKAAPAVRKNAVHLDLVALDLAGEEQRLHALGARRVAEHRSDSGGHWVTMRDPSGHVFDIVEARADQEGRGEPAEMVAGEPAGTVAPER
ncbi:MAG: VOC family protein [Actinomycetes bacterium]